MVKFHFSNVVEGGALCFISKLLWVFLFGVENEVSARPGRAGLFQISTLRRCLREGGRLEGSRGRLEPRDIYPEFEYIEQT